MVSLRRGCVPVQVPDVVVDRHWWRHYWGRYFVRKKGVTRGRLLISESVAWYNKVASKSQGDGRI